MMRRVGLAVLMSVAFPTGTARWSDGGYFVFEGETYRSSDPVWGSIASVDAIAEGLGDELPSTGFSVFPAKDTPVATLDSDALQGSRVKVYIAEFDAPSGQITEAELYYDGRIDRSVLEIGTGWGELAIRAARRGATVHSITLSSEQLALAEERIAEAGYADQVTVALCDYRDLEAPVGPHGATGYDAVVSVEMIEAVGHEYWQTYFETIDRVLAPGGKVAIQAITMPHDRMLATRNTYTWIHKYIFPGGLLPSVEAVDEVTREHTSLRLVERFQFGTHYAETLRLWDEAFLERADEVLALGFDEVFLRMWHFYLEYSRAGFASGYIDDYQLLWERA